MRKVLKISMLMLMCCSVGMAGAVPWEYASMVSPVPEVAVQSPESDVLPVECEVITSGEKVPE